MERNFTAIIKQDGDWWIGWVEEIPGVNCQEETRDALVESLKEALALMLELNRMDAVRAAGENFEELPLAV